MVAYLHEIEMQHGFLPDLGQRGIAHSSGFARAGCNRNKGFKTIVAIDRGNWEGR